MRLAIVSDIHGDHAGLQAALSCMKPFDRLVSLGDAVNQYAYCPETIAILYDHDALAIHGNHEALLFAQHKEGFPASAPAYRDAAEWYYRQPLQRRLAVDGKNLLLTHATPIPGDWRYLTPKTSGFELFAHQADDLIVYGHTHFPVCQRAGAATVVNPGSVGEDRPGARQYTRNCAVLDLTAGEALLIEFDPSNGAFRHAAQHMLF